MVEIDPDVRMTVFDYVDLKEYIADLFDRPRRRCESRLPDPMSVRLRRQMLSAPSERAFGPLRDILRRIDLACRFVNGHDRASFKRICGPPMPSALPGDHIGGLAAPSNGSLSPQP